jgi:GntR family transcriptional regulator/MocR family aminotransferase
MAAIYRRNDLCYSDKNYLNDQDKDRESTDAKTTWQPDTPLYLQLYQRYRDAITPVGYVLGNVCHQYVISPASFTSRGTVEMAYQMLVSEGYLVTKGAAGTQVSSTGEAAERRKSATATQNLCYTGVSDAPDGEYFTVSARCSGAGRVPTENMVSPVGTNTAPD